MLFLGQNLLKSRRADFLGLGQDLEEDDVEDGARGERHDDLDGHRARAVILGRAVVDEVADGEPESGRAGKDACTGIQSELRGEIRRGPALKKGTHWHKGEESPLNAPPDNSVIRQD